MNFSEVREKFEALLLNDNIEEIKQEAGELTREYYNLLDRRPSRSETPENDPDASGVVDYLDDDQIEKIKDAIKIYRERLEKNRQDKDSIEIENFRKKREVVDELTRLISEEENISKAYFRFNELKEVWRNLGNAPQEKQQDVQNEYSRLVELFHYNMNIYKELRENDLKKNIALKNDIITKIDALKDKTNMKELDNALKALQREWDDTGAVPKENWEDFRVRYWAAIQEIQTKLKSHYEEKKIVQVQALDAKKALIEKAKEISKVHANPKEWENATKQIIEIQNAWKGVGFGPREENEVVWGDFRAVCDEFFNAKKAFYDTLKEKASGINAKKDALLERLNTLKDSPEFKETTNKVIALQDEWKKLGVTGLKSDNNYYLKFRAGCDHFFNRKKEFYATNDVRQAENLKRKEEFIASLATVELSENSKQNFDTLKELGNKFKELGDVPFKEKDRIWKAFQDGMNVLWDKAKIARGERDAEDFKERIESIKTAPNSMNAIFKERDFIRGKITRTTEEIAQVENNLGFFAKSKGDNPVLKEYHQKLENLKKDLDSWKGKLKILDKEQKQLAAPKS